MSGSFNGGHRALDAAMWPAESALAAFHTDMLETLFDVMRDIDNDAAARLFLKSLSAKQLDEVLLLLARTLARVGEARDSLGNREQS